MATKRWKGNKAEKGGDERNNGRKYGKEMLRR
jgi:hypothetical protein